MLPPMPVVRSLILLSLFSGLTPGCRRGQPSAPRTRAISRVPLMTARAGFRTRLIRSSFQPSGRAPVPPPKIFWIVHYPSPAGQLVAYLTPDPGDGRKHPAVLWAHGGFGGIDDFLWKKRDQQDPRAFREAGLIVMCPSWRGENDNPGRFELFYGEIDDALAALDYLSRVPYVDPSRIYMAGHSTGGTITLLTAEATRKLRAAFSFGGAPDMVSLVADGRGYGNTPFDFRVESESRLRSPIDFVASIRTPVFYFEGERSAYVRPARQMEGLARALGVPFQPYIVGGGDHFSILQPLTAMVARKIKADTGPGCAITISPAEVRRAFAAGVRDQANSPNHPARKGG
jgi:pimeloyl-ACP methyl ester carboxylesterase